jgi:hypothetical protein
MNCSYSVIDSKENLTIKFKNLYIIDGKIKYLTTDENCKLPVANKWLNVYTWSPEIQYFKSTEALEKYVKNYSLDEINLAVLSDNYFYGNVGHALWDGFYGAYLGALKFGYENEDIQYITTDFSNTKTLAYEIAKTFFGEEKILNYQSLDPNKSAKISTLIVGVGTASNLVMTQKYKLYGKSYDGIERFKNRMYKRFNLNSNLSVGKKAIIIDNKRYNSNEREILHKVINHFKEKIDIKYIDWRNYPSFSDQLKELESVDIHISGPGTGMMYMPFLKKGAVNINLGYMERTQTNSARPNIFIKDCKYEDYIFPGWMEQSVCAGADHVSTLYYDRYNHNTLEFEPLVELIIKSIDLINKGIILENNLNTDAQIFVEYCESSGHSEKICQHLTNIAFFIEMFVAEHPAAIAPSFVNLKLLRSIKEKYSYTKYCY